MSELVVKNELMNVVKLVKHRSINGGDQYIFDCGNGFGASVIKHMFSQGGSEGKWELGVIKFENGKHHLHYDNDIANGDVLGYLDDSEVMGVLEEIANIRK